MESFEFTGDVFSPSPNSGVLAEGFRQLRQEEMCSNSFSITEDNEGTQQTVPRPDTSGTSYDFNDRDVSASSTAQYQQMPANYLPSYNSSTWDDPSFQQHSHFQKETASRSLGNQEMWSSLDSNNSTRLSPLSQTSRMISASFPLHGTRIHSQLAKAHPYFPGCQTVNAPRTENDLQRIDDTTQPSMQTQPVSVATVTGADNTGRPTMPATLRQLLQRLKSPTNEPKNSINVVAILRNNPQLMAALIQQRNIFAIKPNPLVTNAQQQVGASNGNTTTIATQQTQEVIGNFCSTTQQRMMTGGTMIVAQSPPKISRSSDFPATIQQQSTNQLTNLIVANSSGHVPHLETRTSAGSTIMNITQRSRFAIHLPPNQENGGGHDIGKRVDLSGVANQVVGDPVASQLAVARQLIMQAAISAAAAGPTNFSQMLDDQTHSIAHVMKVHCPTFPYGQTQMEAILSLTPSVNSQLPAPKIPTCSICLDQLCQLYYFHVATFYAKLVPQK